MFTRMVNMFASGQPSSRNDHIREHKRTKYRLTTTTMEDALVEQMANLQVQDTRRTSHRMAMPLPELVLEFERLCCDVMNRIACGSSIARSRRIIAFFGAPAIVIAKVWELLHEHQLNDPCANKKHLLWAFHKHKSYSNETTMSSSVRSPDEKTFRKWTNTMAMDVGSLSPMVIRWENRKDGDVGNDCLACVDCLDCPFQQIRAPNPEKEGSKMLNKAICGHNGCVEFFYKQNYC